MPLLFHTGPRGMFPLIVEAVSKVVPIADLRRITFGHVEADQCGSMNQWLAAAPASEVAHGGEGEMVSLNDLADRPPHALEHGKVRDLGGRRVCPIDTPHVPRATCLTPTTGATIHDLAALAPQTLALMRGSSFKGDAPQVLRDLADLYDGWLRAT